MMPQVENSPEVEMPESSGDRARRLGLEQWHALPVYLLGGLLVLAGYVLTVWVTRSLSPLTPFLVTALILPAFAAIIGAVQSASREGESSLRMVFMGLRRFALPSMALGLVPALLVSLTLVSLEIWSQTGGALALIPLALGAAGSIIAVLSLTIALPLRLEYPELSYREIWLTALQALARSPIPPLATIGFAIAATLTALSFTVSLIALVPGPLAAIANASAWSALARLNIRRRHETKPAD